VRLIFPRVPGRLVLYYGNPVARAALYDLDALRFQLAAAAGLGRGEAGPEAPKPAFIRPPPLPLVGTSGAALDAARWRWARVIDIPGEDLFTARLEPEDVAAARANLGDVRIVDGEGRQVPYILEPDAAEGRVDCTLEPAAEGSGGRRRVLRLSLPGGRAVPIRALEIDVADRFFSRPVRVEAPPAPGRHDAEMVAAGILSRTTEGPSGSRPPVRLGLDGARRSELRLVIDEGDNAPLQIATVRAVVPVPRVVFKATAGRYRILFGNEAAAAPRYDLETLRHEVLAYSALPAQPGSLEANERFRRTMSDYLRTPPATLVLWGTLLAAVVGLAGLTARILRAPSA
jgi:hypothetical protein